MAGKCDSEGGGGLWRRQCFHQCVGEAAEVGVSEALSMLPCEVEALM